MGFFGKDKKKAPAKIIEDAEDIPLSLWDESVENEVIQFFKQKEYIVFSTGDTGNYDDQIDLYTDLESKGYVFLRNIGDYTELWRRMK